MQQSVRLFLLTCASLTLSSAAWSDVTENAPTVRDINKRIAVIMVSDPEEVIVENRGGGEGFIPIPIVGALAVKALTRKHSAEFVIVLQKNEVHPGAEMTAALVEQLTLAGYSVDLIKDGIREIDDPKSIDLEKITTDAERILVAKFDDLGLFSGFRTTSYRPRVNLDFDVLRKGDLETLYSQSIDFGADASEANDDEIPSDPKYAYATFDEVIYRQAEVIESYRVGYQQISAQLAKQLAKHGF
jgi:hypothetical protein